MKQADLDRLSGFVCSFSNGLYRVKSPTGKTAVLFDESERFGPSKTNPRSGDLSPISERLTWFWDWYGPWRKAGRPTVGSPLSSPIGPIHTAFGPDRVREPDTASDRSVNDH